MSQQEMQERPHSPISGSKILRFLCCPTSFYKDERDLIDTSPKTAAQEGERAHDYAEQTLLHGEEALEGLRNKQMRSGALAYREFILRCAGQETDRITTETFVQMGANFGLSPSYIGGYYDAMFDGSKELHLFDYKFGFHVVEPDTPQLTFYILAKLMMECGTHGELPVWDKEMHAAIEDTVHGRILRQSIIQPKRKDGIVHTHELPMEVLHKFVDNMCHAVEEYASHDGFVPNGTETNDYCKYCEKRLFCPNAPRDNIPAFNFVKRDRRQTDETGG